MAKPSHETLSPATIVAFLGDIFERRGGEEYLGEPVTMAEHMLQGAHLAELQGEEEIIIVAALLHDVGHLVEEVPDDLADWTTDAGHERIGADWLARRFPPAVSEPVRLHVPAKRYLLATDPAYLANLSPASVVTLKLQGGPMSREEAARFEIERFNREAVLLRRCDDRGKVAGLRTAGLADYRAMIEEWAARRM
jgi:phosphonate degradation associated HDIG domain protein